MNTLGLVWNTNLVSKIHSKYAMKYSRFEEMADFPYWPICTYAIVLYKLSQLIIQRYAKCIMVPYVNGLDSAELNHIVLRGKQSGQIIVKLGIRNAQTHASLFHAKR